MVLRVPVQYAVLITNGEDALGSDARVGACLTRHRANIEEKYAAKLGDRYCTMTLIAAEADDMARLITDHMSELNGLNPSLHMTECEVETSGHDYTLTLYAFEAKDIVTGFTGMLRDLGINITGMAGCRYAAPESGAPMFALHTKISLPDGFALKTLFSDLIELEREHGWDIDIVPRNLPRSAGAPAVMRSFPPTERLRAEVPKTT